MAKHFLASILLMVLVSSASAASSSGSQDSGSLDSCKTKDSCYYDNDLDLCVEERYVPIQDEVDLCDADEPKYEEKAMYEDDDDDDCDLCDDMCDDGSPLDLCEEKTEADAETEKTEKETVKTVVTAAPKLGNVIYGNLEMKMKKNEVDEAEDAVTSVLASALNVPEAAIIKAQLIKQSGRRLQDQSSDLSKYRLQYEVAVPPGQSAKQLLNKANNLPQTIPQRFAQYGVTVADVVHATAPSTFTKNHGLFQATTTTLVPITEKMTWLQIVSRAILLIIPCFAGYLGSIPGFEQKFCCK